MQDDIQSQTTTVAEASQPKGSLIKDLSIPLSIVIAGIFVGAGMYFSGGQAASDTVPLAAAPEQPADTTDKIDPITADENIKGSFDAPVKIVEFSDVDCPFCSRFHEVMNSIVDKYPGDEVAWVYRHFPLEQLHPQAPAVAVASECVAELGGNDAFWNFLDSYMDTRGAGDKTAHAELIPKLVLKAGVSQTAFTECFESGRTEEDVQKDVSDAVETGGRGTPWSIIVGPTGKTYPINGALPQAAVEQMIEVAKQEA